MATRAEQRRAMLLRLGDAAVALFAERGAKVTIDEIAARAGVSRRTVFRWCDAKEELAFVHPLLWLDVFTDALRASNDSLTPSNRLRAAARSLADHIDTAPESPRDAFLVAAAQPELLRGFHSVFQRWVDEIASIAERAGVDPFESRVIGAGVMGMVDATTRAWVAAGPGTTFRSVLDQGMPLVGDLLDHMDDASR